MDILKMIAQQEDVLGTVPATDVQISKAENELGVIFANDYKKCIKEYGNLSVGDHELTGVCSTNENNVVEITREERQLNPEVPKDWYVIEQTDIDSVVIWQVESGEVYQSSLNFEAMKIADSLYEYLLEEEA